MNLNENEVNAAIDIEDDDDPQPDATPNNHKIYKAVSVSQRDTCRLQVVMVEAEVEEIEETEAR